MHQAQKRHQVWIVEVFEQLVEGLCGHLVKRKGGGETKEVKREEARKQEEMRMAMTREHANYQKEGAQGV